MFVSDVNPEGRQPTLLTVSTWSSHLLDVWALSKQVLQDQASNIACNHALLIINHLRNDRGGSRSRLVCSDVKKTCKGALFYYVSTQKTKLFGHKAVAKWKRQHCLLFSRMRASSATCNLGSSTSIFITGSLSHIPHGQHTSILARDLNCCACRFICYFRRSPSRRAETPIDSKPTRRYLLHQSIEQLHHDKLQIRKTAPEVRFGRALGYGRFETSLAPPQCQVGVISSSFLAGAQSLI